MKGRNSLQFKTSHFSLNTIGNRDSVKLPKFEICHLTGYVGYVYTMDASFDSKESGFSEILRSTVLN